MNKILETRLKLRSELEAPPLLRKFGSGWISGVVGFVFGIAALLLMIAVRAPGGVLRSANSNAAREPLVPAGAVRQLLLGAFLASLLSMILRRNKILGIVGLTTATMLATIIGGSNPAPVVKDAAPALFRT